jgi:hypothetical protein
MRLRGEEFLFYVCELVEKARQRLTVHPVNYFGGVAVHGSRTDWRESCVVYICGVGEETYA